MKRHSHFVLQGQLRASPRDVETAPSAYPRHSRSAPARATQVGSEWRYRGRYGKVCLPSKTLRQCGHRGTAAVPLADIMQCSTKHLYLITSSAATRSVCGTVRPSILAVWALMTNSSLLACTTGRSDGFAPLRMRPV